MRTSDRSARADRAWQCPAAIAVTLATGALYALVAFVSIELTRDGGRLAAVWLPNALALAVLLRGPAGREGALLGSVLLGNIAAAVIVGDGLVKALTLAACNVLELAVALILIRRACRPFAVMKRIDHLTRFVASAGLAAPAVSATLATLALGLEDQLVPALWGHWFVAHSLGMIVVTPAALIIFDAISAPRLPTRREVARWAALTVGGAGVAAGVFIQDGYPLLFLIAPVVVLHAFVLGSLGTAISVLMIAAVATVCTWQGSGPINLVAGPLAERLMVLQAFIASAFAIGLPVAAVLSGKRRVVALLEKRSARLRLLSQAISDAVLRFDAQGQCTYASPSVRAVLGLAPELLLGRRASERAHPQARMAIAQAEARLLGGVSERERITYRRFADDEHGNAVFIVADAVLVRDEPGGAIDGIVVCLRDATERVALERALAWTERRLAEAGANRADFVAGMGSAIRARVEQMQVAALQLAHAERNAPGRRETEEIAAAGGRLLRLISAIDDLATIEAGRRPTRPVPVGLRQLLEACVGAHHPQAGDRALSLNLFCAPEIPATIVTDGAHLR